MLKKIRTGVLGVGTMGANHARVYAELPESDLVGVFDADRARAEACAGRFGCRAFPTLNGFLHAGIEAVSVAAPTSLHHELVLQALEAGMHVLVEKPIAATRPEAEAMIRAAEGAGRKLMVGHIERFNPAVRAIKKAVRPEEIISINVVRVGPRPPRIKDAGVIIDMAVHDIDLVHFLTGSTVEEVFCVTSANFDLFEDTASILLRMNNVVGAQLTANWITPYKAREIQVITADRLIRADLLTRHVQESSRYSGDDGSYLVRDMYVRHREPLLAQLQAFLDAVATDAPPAITGEDGLRVLDVAIRASAYKKQPVIRVAS